MQFYPIIYIISLSQGTAQGIPTIGAHTHLTNVCWVSTVCTVPGPEHSRVSKVPALTKLLFILVLLIQVFSLGQANQFCRGDVYQYYILFREILVETVLHTIFQENSNMRSLKPCEWAMENNVLVCCLFDWKYFLLSPEDRLMPARDFPLQG